MIYKIKTKRIKAASISHAKEILGEEQFKKNKEAVKVISEDFIAGILWFKKELKTMQNEKI